MMKLKALFFLTLCSIAAIGCGADSITFQHDAEFLNSEMSAEGFTKQAIFKIQFSSKIVSLDYRKNGQTTLSLKAHLSSGNESTDLLHGPHNGKTEDGNYTVYTNLEQDAQCYRGDIAIYSLDHSTLISYFPIEFCDSTKQKLKTDKRSDEVRPVTHY